MAEKKSSPKNAQKEIILRALTEPSFKKLLSSDPAKALGKEVTPELQKEVKIILATVKGIDTHIAALADELLCANGGGPCGIC